MPLKFNTALIFNVLCDHDLEKPKIQRVGQISVIRGRFRVQDWDEAADLGDLRKGRRSGRAQGQSF
jgi:hypothetical protein